MMPVKDPTAGFRSMVDESARDLPGHELQWLEALRQKAGDDFRHMDFPNRKQESWRYTSVDALLKNDFILPTTEFTALQDQDIEDLLIPELESYRLVFANGRLVDELSSNDPLPEGISLGSLRGAMELRPDLVAEYLGKVGKEKHVFAALNTALINDGLFLHIEKDVVVDLPVEVIYLSTALEDSIVSQPRNLIVLESGAAATVVERYVSTGQSIYFNNLLTEILLKDQASLTHYQLQEESRSAFHLCNQFVRQEGLSQYHYTGMTMGGAWSRVDHELEFHNPGAQAEMNGLYLAGEHQLSDYHINVLHNVPGCSSRENFKGILYGRGRGVFDGRILVNPQAQKTDAHLSNANLLLSRDAEVDTKPQLEIYADDVKCSHGTTVGQLEPDQLYYLCSRGIGKMTARSMLCQAFAEEILDTCKLTPVRERAKQILQQRLSEVEIFSTKQE